MARAQTAEEQSLVNIGLSPSAARCYLFLAAQLPYARRSAYIAEHLQGVVSRASIFRALDELVVRGFVKRQVAWGHASFRAEWLAWALENYAIYQRQQVLPIVKAQRDREKPAN